MKRKLLCFKIDPRHPRGVSKMQLITNSQKIYLHVTLRNIVGIARAVHEALSEKLFLKNAFSTVGEVYF
jgi:hypothetical protein